MANIQGAVAPVAKTTPPVKDVTTASFRADVLNASLKQPVLVDFWAPWCGPCKQLAPALEKAVADSNGKVTLVKMNIDDHPQIPGQLGIQSIPAVIAFDKGQPVDGFVGALPESQIRGFIERLIGPLKSGSADLLAEAEEAAAAGDAAGAASIYAEILAEDPAEAKAIAGLAKLQIAAGQLAEAKGLLQTAPEPPPGKDQDPAIAAALAALRLAEQASSVGELKPLEQRVAANPNDLQARFDLAVALSAKGERDGAADQLLEIIKRDRKWNDEAARKQLLQLFEAWGIMDPATVAARRKLSAIWF
ncbi:MAG: thioredoxin [Hyphomicrobiales bacterium]|nr:thioredoxin [Hyphomicrobiales bacterium]